MTVTAANLPDVKGLNGDEAPPPPTHRDLQRGALQELVELVGISADQQVELDKRLEAALAENQTLAQRSTAEAERKFKKLGEQIVERYQQRSAQIEAQYQKTIKTIAATDATMRNRARHDLEQKQQEVKKTYEQAIWLADSVLESGEGRIAEELNKVRNTHNLNAEWLAGEETEAQALLDRYAQPPGQSTPLAAVRDAEADTGDAAASFTRSKEVIEKQLAKLGSLKIPNLMVGGKPYVYGTIFIVIIAGIPLLLAKDMSSPPWQQIGIAAGAALVVAIVLGLMLRSMSRRQISETFTPLRGALDAAAEANKNLVERATMQHDMDMAQAGLQHKGEVQHARDANGPVLDAAMKAREAALKAAAAATEKSNADNVKEYKAARAELEEWKKSKSLEVDQRHQEDLAGIASRAAAKEKELRDAYAADRAGLEGRWTGGLQRIREPINENGAMRIPWNDRSWDNWKSPTKFPQTIRFGELHIDMRTILSDLKKQDFTLPIPDSFAVPGLLAFPRQASLMLHTDRGGRMDAIHIMQMVMTRLLTCVPPGRVRFTLIDPVGLGQNFSGFMHLADHDEALIGGKIWTGADEIDRRLENLTEHMETVIQKYLRNEYATIDDYNAQAGELAEPYRFLVISDFPVNFSDDAFHRLSSIATTGARCGVYTIIMRDTRITTGTGTHLDDLEAHSVNLIREADKFVWRDEVFQRFPLSLDEPPEENDLTKIMHLVGQRAKEAKRVEVPFNTIAPPRDKFWTMKSDQDVSVFVGKTGATRLQAFRVGRGVAQHALIAGKTGSGKSTLLHALISNLAMWYSPQEIELYLIDFKKGVEFKTYAMHHLPHARAIAVESDREFGLSVLQRIDAEMSRRAELFRPFKAQNLGAYRESSGKIMPRTLLIIDEFQEFFTEDDKLAADAALLLDRVVRQGRAFGVHLLLGSQTIGGSSGLSRSTIGQIAIRVALQTSEADSQMILGDGNSAARLLSRPGEAIYNDAGGLVEGNSPFQVAWLPDEERDTFLDAVNAKLKESGIHPELPIVFEGNEPADYRGNPRIAAALAAPKYNPAAQPTMWLGDPVSIKDPTSITFRRQSGSNVIIIGQSEEGAMGIITHSMIALAAQLGPNQASFRVLDGTPPDQPMSGVLAKVAAVLPNEAKMVEYRAVPGVIHEVFKEMERRQADESNPNPPSIFLVIFGLQRFRMLRKNEESFSFSSGGDEEKPPDPGKEFADLLREGPALGIHVLAWIDTATAMERTVDRGSMRELDHRILFQMSAADSSNLIDSPTANKLGQNRGLSYSEEQGSIEKFRPYALPNAEWLEQVKEQLGKKVEGK